MLWPDPAQKPRLTEIRDNLVARIPGEAEREGWLGEVDGLRISFTAAEHKLAQLDATTTRHHRRRARHPYAHDKPLTDANPRWSTTSCINPSKEIYPRTNMQSSISSTGW
jgi:hypothetical protein